MDETALLALGILMEEVCRDSLGKSGDLVFTEGEVHGKDDAKISGGASHGEPSVITLHKAARKSGRSRSGKRRKVHVESPVPNDDD